MNQLLINKYKPKNITDFFFPKNIENLVFDIKTIIQFVKKDYPEIEIRFIYKALEDLLKNNEFIEDKFRRKSKLIYAGDYYILEPVELAELKLPVLYREKPLSKKPRSFKII